jgi:hypothetical protein
MSNVEPQISSEAVPIVVNVVPPASKTDGKVKSKKLKKQSLANIEPEHTYSGRIAALKIIGQDDQVCAIVFHLKGKKNNGVHFTVRATQISQFAASNAALNTALLKDFKVKVIALPSEAGPRPVSELSILA